MLRNSFVLAGLVSGAIALLLALPAPARAGADEPAATDQPLRIDAEAVVAAPRADVWRAWTTNEGLQTFFAQHTNVELRQDGPFEIMFSLEPPAGQRGSEGCTVLSYLPEEMLSFSWNAPPKFEHARTHRTIVVVRLDTAGPDRTRVRLTHHGFTEQIRAHPDHEQEWRDVHAYFSRAWPYVLANLQQRFEPAPTEDAVAAEPQFMYTLRPARAAMVSEGPTSVEAEAVAAHFEYLKQLCEQGVVLLAGRTSGVPEDTLGIVVFRAADAASAERIMRADPAVARGVMTARVFPYRAALIAPDVEPFRP